MSGIVTTLPIAPGALLHNKYEPMQMIGGGNFGEVWLAKDHAVDHTYAIRSPTTILSGFIRPMCSPTDE